MPAFRRFLRALCSIFLVALAHAGTEKVIHNFNPAPQGYFPLGTVVADQLGNLYGTANYGGTLQIVNLGGKLSPGDTFRLFSSVNATGNFSSIIRNTHQLRLM